MPANPRRLRPFLDEPEVRRDVELLRVDALDDRPPVDRREPERFFDCALERERVDLDELDDLERLELERLDPDRLELDRLELDFERLEPERRDDFFPRCDLVSPFSRLILLTVRAATSSARPP
jgi:hypothetical protein